MPAIVSRYATPLITGLFVISLVTGIALFFHICPTGFRPMHEWLSLVLLLPFVLHIWKNWRPFLAYFRRAPMLIALAGSLAVGALFLLPIGGADAGGPPQFVLAQKVLGGTVEQVAPLLGLTPADLTGRLTAAGFAVSDPEISLHQIAVSAGKSDAELAETLVEG